MSGYFLLHASEQCSVRNICLIFLDLSGTVVTCEHLSVSVLDLSGSYLRVLVNSDLLLMNSDMSSLSILRAFCLNWHICLSINLYPRNYHNLAN